MLLSTELCSGEKMRQALKEKGKTMEAKLDLEPFVNTSKACVILEIVVGEKVDEFSYNS